MYNISLTSSNWQSPNFSFTSPKIFLDTPRRFSAVKTLLLMAFRESKSRSATSGARIPEQNEDFLLSGGGTKQEDAHRTNDL